MTFQSMCADAEAVFAYATSLGASSVGVIGTRMGALVGAAILANRPGVPMAIWEPIPNMESFIREAGRAKRMSQITQEASGEIPNWQQELADNDGVLDIVGYDLYPAFIESFHGINLLSLLGAGSRKLFVAHFGGRVRAHDLFAANLRDQGFDVESGSFGSRESWWLDKETVTDSSELITATTAWMSKSLEKGQ
jgi:hypothetical protein